MVNHVPSVAPPGARCQLPRPRCLPLATLLLILTLIALPRPSAAEIEISEEEVMAFIEIVTSETNEALIVEMLRDRAVKAELVGLGETLSSIPYTDWTGAATSYYEGDPVGAQRWSLSGLGKAMAAKATSAGAAFVLGTGSTAAAPIAAGILASVLTEMVIDHYYRAKDLREAKHRDERLGFYEMMLSEFKQQARQQQDQVYSRLREMLVEGPMRMQWAQAVFDDHRAMLNQSQESYRSQYHRVEASVRARYAHMPREGLLLSGTQEDYVDFLIQAEQSYYYRHYSFLQSLRDEMDDLFPELSRSDPVRVSIKALGEPVRFHRGDTFTYVTIEADKHMHWQIAGRVQFADYRDDLKDRLLSVELHTLDYEDLLRTGIYYHEWQVKEDVHAGGLSHFADTLTDTWMMWPTEGEVHVTVKLYLVTDRSVSVHNGHVNDYDAVDKVLLSEDSATITFEEQEGSYASAGARLQLPYTYAVTGAPETSDEQLATAHFEFDSEDDRTLWDGHGLITGTFRWPDERCAFTVADDGLSLAHIEFTTVRDYGNATVQLHFAFRDIPLRYKADLGPHVGHIALFWAKGSDLMARAVSYSAENRYEQTHWDPELRESVTTVVLSTLKDVAWPDGYIVVQLNTYTLADLREKVQRGELSQVEVDEIEQSLDRAARESAELFAEDEGGH